MKLSTSLQRENSIMLSDFSGSDQKAVPQKQKETAQRTYIPQALRDEVFVRDGGCCAYVSADGRRCGSRWNLEVDHITPVARRGGSELENLRLLCRGHNRYEAERVFGKELMGRYVSL